MFSKVVIRVSIPFFLTTLLIMSILTIVMPASTIGTAPQAELDQFVYLPIVLKPPSPPGPNWIQMYSNSNDSDVSFNNFVRYSEDKYVISGWTKNPGYIGLLTTVDGNGNILWQTGISQQFRDMIVTSDNHILVSGWSDNNLLIMKFTTEGSVVWANQYGGEEQVIESGPILELKDGSYIVVGEAVGYGNGGRDAFVINLNPDGSMVWQKTIGDIYGEFIYAATVTSDNTILIIGETTHTPPTSTAPWLLELGADGTVLWQKEIPDSGCNFKSIIELQDGNFLAAGSGTAPGCLLKLGNDGGPLWQKQVGEAYYGNLEAVIHTGDGTVLVSGYKMKPGTTINDGWLMAFDTDGTLLWEKTYGDQDANLFTDIQILNSGQLAIAGYTYLFTDEPDEQSMGWLLKLDPDGSLDNCDWIHTGSSIITDTVPTASTINLGTTVPTSTMTTATYTLYDISLIPSQLCSGANNLAACD